jgi:hypothetical protein
MRRTTTSWLVSALVAVGATALATPSAWAAEPSAPAPSVADRATLYLVQGVDAATMSLAVDGRVVVKEAVEKTVAGPYRLTPGSHTVTATPTSGPPVSATLALKAGESVDAVLHRQVDASKQPVFTAYPNDLTAVTEGSGRLTVAHTAAVGPADIRVKGKVLFANVANGEELTLTVPSGTYPVDIVPTAATAPVVLGPVDLPVAASALTRVFAIGVAATGSMDAVVQDLPVASRGSGSTVSKVDAGDGGQAQALIVAAHQRSGTADPGAAVSGAEGWGAEGWGAGAPTFPGVVLLLVVVAGLLLAGSRRARRRA